MQRNIKVTFRLNKAEHARFKCNVARAGVSQEAYFRHFINGYALPDKPPPDYYSMMKELYKIGVNINQLAHMANATGVIDTEKYSEDARLLKGAIEKITKAVISPRKTT